MDFLHLEGVKFIHLLQTRMTNEAFVEKFVETPQYFADPDTLMVVVFPLLLVLNRWLACRFALTIGVVDMINTVLKWILQGDRPYWWVQEVNQTKFSTLPQLQQLPLTCEAGPGSPSGHAMTSAAVGFVLVSMVIDQHVHKLGEWKRRITESMMWLGYALAVSAIGLARLRLATHFPHQVIMGAVAGLAGGWLVWNLPVEKFQRRHFFIAGLCFFAWAVITYFGLQLLGIDPNRTIQLALKHCAVRSYVKLSTTPWHSVYRNFSIIMATGYCITSPSWAQVVSKIRFNSVQKVIIAITSALIVRGFASIPYPHQPTSIFYTCTVFKNSCMVSSCLLLVPMAIAKISGSVPKVADHSEIGKKRSNAMIVRQG